MGKLDSSPKPKPTMSDLEDVIQSLGRASNAYWQCEKNSRGYAWVCDELARLSEQIYRDFYSGDSPHNPACYFENVDSDPLKCQANLEGGDA